MIYLRRLAATTALAMLGTAAFAEDIDLFIGAASTNTDLPNVLFIIDNTANWNQAFEIEKQALINTFDRLPEGRYNVGIMLATETGQGNNNVKGGYVRAAIRTMDTANKGAYSALINSLDKLADKGDGGYSALTMAEAYYYFKGARPYAGNYKVKTDYFNNLTGTQASKNVYALPGNALSSLVATQYHAPHRSDCVKDFIIYISNGPNQQNSSTDASAAQMLRDAGGNSTQIPLSPSGSQSNPADEWARFMREKHNIITYTIDVNPPTSGQGPGWSRLLQSMAGNPNRYKEVSTSSGSGQDLEDALAEAFSEIQAVNSVFASVSLPLSVNTQGTYLNQVYVGLFRPDENALPRWAGNLKQYKLAFVNATDLRLVDADSAPAINPGTGFVTECARSYWTPDSADSYWSFRPQGQCIATGDDVAMNSVSNSPDGNVVEKGAHAMKLRAATPASRNVRTCALPGCGQLTSFNSSNGAITSALLQTTDADRTNLIDWARGKDVLDENANGDLTEMRPYSHGDVVHSRPVALNLGTEGNPKIVVFYGGNDGMLRAINGSRDSNLGSAGAGDELWAFLPPEFYPQLKRLRDNDVQISFPNITDGDPLPKPYGIDGPITAHRGATGASIFSALRRGGRSLYAFGVEASDPANISLKWRKGCSANFAADGTISSDECSDGYEDIGQTWSAPKVALARGHHNGTKPLLVMGGGYDVCEDRNPATCSDPKGNGIYVIDAESGDVLRRLPTDRSVVADVALVQDASGLAIYGYAADLGGNVYRIEMGAQEPSDWEITRIAAVGCSSTDSCASSRKFMFAPDVLFESGTYVLLLGSGDREKPREYASSIDNYFFMIRDKPGDANWLADEEARCGAAVMCLSSLQPILTETAPSAAQLATKKGWYLGLRRNEQVVTSAITIFGTVTFSSHEPKQAQEGVCKSDLGTARVYNVNWANAAGEITATDRSEELPPHIGLPPSPVAGLVTLDDGRTVPFCIGCRAESPLEGEEPKVPPSSAPTQPKSRVYWYIQR